MPRDGSVVFGDLKDKLEVLHVACKKCDRRGQYPVARLIERYGRDAKLVDWKDTITADCTRRTKASVAVLISAARTFRICCGYKSSAAAHALAKS